MLGGEVLARRVMPLVALLRLSLLFPGPAPSRVALTRQSTRRELNALTARVLEHGLGETAEVAANTLIRLIAALDAHDRRTRGHSERVRALADLLAEELHLNEHDRDRLRWAALLHDIGKLAVPVEVLRKPGRLSDDEWAMIHAHPAEGDRMLGGLREWLGAFAPVALEHHERWDGTGYPQGLAGEDICFGARVVAVADSYDVMTSVRSYQPRPRSAEAALTEVVDCAGTQFDPQVARAMVNLSGRRLWMVLGPLAWLAQIPFVGPVASAGITSQAVGLGSGAAASVVVASGTQGGFRNFRDLNVPAPSMTVPVEPPTSTTSPGGRTSSATMPPSSSTSTTGSFSSTSIPGLVGSGPVRPCPAPTASTTTIVPPTPSTAPTVGSSTTVPAPPDRGRPPEPAPDETQVQRTAVIDIDVLANDTDPDDDLVRASLRLAEAPSSGAASVVGDRLRYNAGPVAGSVRLQYAVEDGSGNCATATVTITVRWLWRPAVRSGRGRPSMGRRERSEGVGGRVAGLVDHDGVGAGDLDHRRDAVALIVGALGEGGSLGLQLGDRRREVVAHEADQVLAGAPVLLPLPDGDGRVDAHLARSRTEDQPAIAGRPVLDERQPQHVSEEGTGGGGVVGVDEVVHSRDHPTHARTGRGGQRRSAACWFSRCRWAGR
ncbi:MAG: hypothetical protein JWO77_974 [Ilumatobacteraceae bacterium]|nr:hypothetical protein [Ilumatobacteraceae bacterium]